jgi:DNA (cytosine-5)-methyltransferase 1
MALTVGSLFSGIGGIDLGLERAGMESRWFVEWDAHCQNVLRRHWPGLPVYGDITAVDWSTVEPVDVLAGGFPCQPVSSAGLRRGTEDERWLWPEFERAVGALRPRYVLVENVAALRHRGLGLVLGGLAALGYDAEWDCIPAAAVGAPHLRDRLWIVAYPQSDRRSFRHIGDAERHPGSPNGKRVRNEPRGDGSGRRARLVAYPSSDGRGQGRTKSEGQQGRLGLISRSPRVFDREPFGVWSPEPDVGRVAHGIPHRVDRLRALGNAVVPQVVEWIGRRIVAFDEDREVKAA